jgi:hypothetical protein
MGLPEHGRTLEDAHEMLAASGFVPVHDTSGSSLLVHARADAAKLTVTVTLAEACTGLGGACLIAAALYPILIPVERRLVVMDYIIRANEYEDLGVLKLDADEGDLCLAVTAPCEAGGFSGDLLDRIVWTAVERLDAHLPALGAVLYAGERAVVALDRVYRFDLLSAVVQATGDL